MKIVRKSIETVAWFEQDGTPHPIRFRMKNDDETWNLIKIGRVVTIEKEKLAGNHMYVFQCQSIINEVLQTYELKYELDTCKWILWKV